MPLSDQDLLAQLPRAPEKRTASEICKRLSRGGNNPTARTVQRRLVKLSQTYPLVSDERSKPYGWSIRRDAPPTMGAMSLQEALALKMGQRFLAELLPVEVAEGLKAYFAQADQMLKESKLYRAWMDKIRIISPTQPLVKPHIGRNILSACYDAVLTEKRLQLTYEREAGKRKSYKIDALGIVVRGPVTYLVARFDHAPNEALLVMHRIKAAKVQTEAYVNQAAFNLDAFIREGAFGFFPESNQLLSVQFFDNAAKHLLETPFSETQNLVETASGEHLLTVRTEITEQLKWWLLGFGARAEVRAPIALRREFAKRFKAAARLYE